MFGLDPERGVSGTFSFGVLYDSASTNNRAITCGYAPRAQGSDIIPMASSLYLGTINCSNMLESFVPELAMDGSIEVSAELITGRIDPTLDSGETLSKRHLKLEFPEVNPLDRGYDVQYAMDVLDEDVLSAAPWEDVLPETDGNRADIENGLGNWMHLRVVTDGTANSQGNYVGFNSFQVHFNPLYTRSRGEN